MQVQLHLNKVCLQKKKTFSNLNFYSLKGNNTLYSCYTRSYCQSWVSLIVNYHLWSNFASSIHNLKVLVLMWNHGDFLHSSDNLKGKTGLTWLYFTVTSVSLRKGPHSVLFCISGLQHISHLHVLRNRQNLIYHYTEEKKE